jgi:hypothetical protein
MTPVCGEYSHFGKMTKESIKMHKKKKKEYKLLRFE